MPRSDRHEMMAFKKRPHRVQPPRRCCLLGFSYRRGGVSHNRLEKQSGGYRPCSPFDVSSAAQLALFSRSQRRDKWAGVPLVGDSSTQWELTTSVCLRYAVFVELPATNSFIIARQNYGREWESELKWVTAVFLSFVVTSWHQFPFVYVTRISEMDENPGLSGTKYVKWWITLRQTVCNKYEKEHLESIIITEINQWNYAKSTYLELLKVQYNKTLSGLKHINTI